MWAYGIRIYVVLILTFSRTRSIFSPPLAQMARFRTFSFQPIRRPLRAPLPRLPQTRKRERVLKRRATRSLPVCAGSVFSKTRPEKASRTAVIPHRLLQERQQVPHGGAEGGAPRGRHRDRGVRRVQHQEDDGVLQQDAHRAQGAGRVREGGVAGLPFPFECR